jgi:hypothetical protein
MGRRFVREMAAQLGVSPERIEVEKVSLDFA